jgi:hypothetical protein
MDIALKFPLKELLQTALAGNATDLQLREMSRLLCTLALSFVRRNVYAGTLRLDVIGLSEQDVAHDCIADFFKRNEQNKLVELHAYFESQKIRIDEQRDEVLLSHLRRLVSRKVNDTISRMHKDSDSALWKILRNLKEAVGKSNHFTLTERFGAYYLVPSACDLLPNLPTIGDDELRNEVNAILKVDDEMPAFLERFAEMLCSQKTYRRKVGLMSLAAAIKARYEQLRVFTYEERNEAEMRLFAQDIRLMIRETCKEISAERKPRYVDKDKVDEETFSRYMQAVEQILCDAFLEGSDGIPPAESYYDYLKQFDSMLTKADYLKKHRAIFEYLVKLSKELAKEKLKKM